MKPDGTIREAYLQASSFLERQEVPESSTVTELLLRHLLGWSRTDLFLRWGEPFPAEKREEWSRLLERKASGEPVQYIIGEQEFYGLPFRVTPAVLIPRPETELLVEQIVLLGRSLWPPGGPVPSVADIGTGSGAIPVTIAVQCPDWRVSGTDISADALEVARGNAELNGVADRIAFYQGDLLEPYIRDAIPVDILVSNPPYIETGDIAGLEAQVRCYEPLLALDGGPDGLTFYRRIVDQLERLPAIPRLIGFEVGQGQARDVAAMLERAAHWDEIRIVPDLAGIERHVIGLSKF
jgi:release factor glutamine methyltransferase